MKWCVQSWRRLDHAKPPKTGFSKTGLRPKRPRERRSPIQPWNSLASVFAHML
jgi:hypothetical protein